MKREEHNLQVACVAWFRLQYPQYAKLLFAVPNGGYRNRIEAKRLKKEGVLAGVPDLIFLYRGLVYPIEMKTKNGKLGSNQKELHEFWNEHLQCNVFVCRSFDQFKEIINNIIVND